jgi:hypothetical protein
MAVHILWSYGMFVENETGDLKDAQGVNTNGTKVNQAKPATMTDHRTA